jgi:hypothetical protein
MRTYQDASHDDQVRVCYWCGICGHCRADRTSIEIYQSFCFVSAGFHIEMVAQLKTIDERQDNRPKDHVGYPFHFERRI